MVEVAGREHVMTPPQPQDPLQAELARVGRLVGYDLPATEVAPGDTLDLTLYWQATESTGDRLAVFVHLLDAQGKIIGQSDSEPATATIPPPAGYLANIATTEHYSSWRPPPVRPLWSSGSTTGHELNEFPGSMQPANPVVTRCHCQIPSRCGFDET